jgi:cyclic pyranopterin phosphate synthase
MEKEHVERNNYKLVDAFGRKHNYLRLSLTDQCNLRCSYCMPVNPVFLPHNTLLTRTEILKLAEEFVALGIDKIRLTGGEPLYRKDFDGILSDLAQFPVSLHLTTNGYFVDRFITPLRKHMTSVNVSLDTLQKDKFKLITQRNAFERTLENIDLLLRNEIKTKINVVVVRNVNDEEIPDFIALMRDHPIEIRFIEFMPFSGNRWKLAQTYPHHDIIEQVKQKFRITPIVKENHQTAQRFSIEGYAGSFGIISTVSHPFCGDCNRIRVTADGKIKNCLFSGDETDLRSLIGRPELLRSTIERIIFRKHFAHGGKAPIKTAEYGNDYNENRTMTAIGG